MTLNEKSMASSWIFSNPYETCSFMSLLVWIIGFVTADMFISLSLCEMTLVLSQKAQFES